MVPDYDIRWKKVVHTKNAVLKGGKKVARRGHRWSQTGTAVSHGHPVLWVRITLSTNPPMVVLVVSKLCFDSDKYIFDLI